MSGDCIPLELVNRITDRYPGCWKVIDEVYVSAKGTDGLPDWDSRCYVPIAATIAIVYGEGTPLYKGAHPEEKAIEASLMAVLAPWRLHKQIFQFTPEMEDLLYAQASDLEIPIDTLYNLPYPCVYIKLCRADAYFQLEFGRGLDGFFVSFEHDTKAGRMELRLTLVFDSNEYCFIPVHLSTGGTISDGLNWIMGLDTHLQDKGTFKNVYVHTRGIVEKLLQLVLYICAENAEITEDPERAKTTRIPRSKEFIRDKYREVQWFSCAAHTTEIIRRYGKGMGGTPIQGTTSGKKGTGTLKRPHSRRGHWHHYWAGSGADRHLILKWNPPTFIHSELAADHDITINQVQDKGQRR